jgi:hypothetical protein
MLRDADTWQRGQAQKQEGEDTASRLPGAFPEIVAPCHRFPPKASSRKQPLAQPFYE